MQRMDDGQAAVRGLAHECTVEWSVRLRIGMPTPSSNTVLEPITTVMLDQLSEFSVHFSRFRVTANGLDAPPPRSKSSMRRPCWQRRRFWPMPASM